MWNIPAEFMKMKKPHKVPLSKEAFFLIQTKQHYLTHCIYCFFMLAINTMYSIHAYVGAVAFKCTILIRKVNTAFMNKVGL